MATIPRTHRNTALVVTAIVGGGTWLAVPIAIAMEGNPSAAVALAMIVGCGLGAFVAMTIVRMSLVTAGVAGAVAALLLQGLLVALFDRPLSVGEELRMAGLAGLVAGLGAFAGGRRPRDPMLVTASALVVLGVTSLLWTGGALWSQASHPHQNVAILFVVALAPLAGGVVCGLLVPGSNPGHVALSWLGLVIGMTFAVAIAARTPLAIGPGLLMVLIVVPFLSGLSAFGLWLVKRRPDPPPDVLPEARTL